MKWFTIFIVKPFTIEDKYALDFISSVSQIEPFPAVSDEGNISFLYGRLTSEDDSVMIGFLSKSGNLDLNIVLSFFLDKKPKPDEFLGYIVFADGQYLSFQGAPPLEVKEEIRGNMKFRQYPIKADTDIRGLIERSTFGDNSQGWLYLKAAREDIKTLRKLDPHAPWVIAAVNLNTPNAVPLNQLHKELDVDNTISIIPCDPQDKNSVKNILLTLLSLHKPDSRINKVIQTIQEA